MDLLTLALDAADARHSRERQDINSRAKKLAGIQETLSALQNAGLLLVLQAVRFRGSLAITCCAEFEVAATAAADARNLGAHRLQDAGFRETSWPTYPDAGVWHHPAGWRLTITWLGSADVSTRRSEVAA
ncbi:hypothetical protein GPA19_08120 [Azoarcus indigens]|uniref:Uncharacterized protein n=1 Tax=Azoarcus indigens TaxID=29545 RepID=A0A4R6DYL6_9RHOO|nr:hypothetical protein [Azoarcus indigens]NMG64910.1 hypothetical protein [Azoarcus indigens]TDN50447.1 hypothetical protein C7389_109141 [Azoarcus indigens]